MLTELERHEGLCVLATNRPMDLDEAMHRRITLAIEFTKPDLLLRERIWRQMAPPKLELAKDVDFMALARKYELPGGFIKNAWLSALSIAVARDGVQCVVNHADLHAGASHQLRGRLAMSNFDRGVVPTRGLEDVQLPKEVKEKLKQIVNYSKAQARAILRNSGAILRNYSDAVATTSGGALWSVGLPAAARQSAGDRRPLSRRPRHRQDAGGRGGGLRHRPSLDGRQLRPADR